jgi:hypothetical protein
MTRPEDTLAQKLAAIRDADPTLPLNAMIDQARAACPEADAAYNRRYHGHPQGHAAAVVPPVRKEVPIYKEATQPGYTGLLADAQGHLADEATQFKYWKAHPDRYQAWLGLSRTARKSREG